MFLYKKLEMFYFNCFSFWIPEKPFCKFATRQKRLSVSFIVNFCARRRAEQEGQVRIFCRKFGRKFIFRSSTMSAACCRIFPSGVSATGWLSVLVTGPGSQLRGGGGSHIRYQDLTLISWGQKQIPNSLRTKNWESDGRFVQLPFTSSFYQLKEAWTNGWNFPRLQVSKYPMAGILVCNTESPQHGIILEIFMFRVVMVTIG